MTLLADYTESRNPMHSSKTKIHDYFYLSRFEKTVGHFAPAIFKPTHVFKLQPNLVLCFKNVIIMQVERSK